MLWETRFRRWCKDCDRYVLAQKKNAHILGHAALTVVTCGLWLLIAIPMLGYDSLFRPAMCPNCGRRC